MPAIPTVHPTGLAGLLGAAEPGYAFDATGAACGIGDACASYGLPGWDARQDDPALRPLCIDTVAGVQPLFGTDWMQMDRLAATLSGQGVPLTILFCAIPIGEGGGSVVAAGGGDSGAYRRITADSGGIRYQNHGDGGVTATVNRTGIVPPASGPYIGGAVDTGAVGHIRRHGGRCRTDGTTIANGAGDPVGQVTLDRVTLGGTRDALDVLTNAYEGCVPCFYLYARALSEAECYALEERMAYLVPGVKLAQFRVRYASAVSGADTNDGLFEDSAFLRPIVAAGYDPATIYTEAPSWSQGFTASLEWSRSVPCEILPYPGQAYSYWDLTDSVTGPWTAMGGGIWQKAITHVGTAFTVGFTELPGPRGAPWLLLRKVNGDLPQTSPDAGDYGWIPNVDPATGGTAVVNTGDVDPETIGPIVDSAPYGICGFGAGKLTLRRQVVVGPGVAGFACGDSPTSLGQFDGVEMDLHDCHARLCGTGSAGGFAIRGKGRLMRLWDCTAAYIANDGFSIHGRKDLVGGVRMETRRCKGYSNQDQGGSVHDGKEWIDEDGVYWNNGDGPTTSVYNSATDASVTFLGLRRTTWFGNDGTYPGGGFADSNLGAGYAEGCRGDAEINVPAGADFRVSNFELADAADLAAGLPSMDGLPD